MSYMTESDFLGKELDHNISNYIIYNLRCPRGINKNVKVLSKIRNTVGVVSLICSPPQAPRTKISKEGSSPRKSHRKPPVFFPFTGLPPGIDSHHSEKF